MRKLLALSAVLSIGMATSAQEANSEKYMENQKKTIRLVYPQWQGGSIAQWITEVKDPEQASRGYYLGAQLLDFLAPVNGQETYTVPISTALVKRKVTDGVLDKDAIIVQTKAALEILDMQKPDRIVTLGGECSTSVVPFTYLSKKYGGDVAMVWIDAHPDITLPGDVYPAYHAMAVTACMGLGDSEIISELPAKIDPSKILFVGLRDWERDEIKARQKQYGIRHLTPEDVRDNSRAVLEWLKACGASKVVIHFDMDVLDPAEIIAAVGVVPNGMKIAEVVRVINDIAREKEIVGLTVAEPMPRTAIRLKEMLNQLPLLNTQETKRGCEVERNKNVVAKLLSEALPDGDMNFIKEVVSPDCITHRAGFASLYAATSDAIPQKGNFLQWVEKGWKPLSEALGEQHVEIRHIVGERNVVMAQYHYSVKHKGTFVGMEATNKKMEWDETAIIHFGEDGKITDMWYMCDELGLARQLGFSLQ